MCVARSRLREVECSLEMGLEAPQISQTASFDAIRPHRDLGLSAHSTFSCRSPLPSEWSHDCWVFRLSQQVSLRGPPRSFIPCWRSLPGRLS